jgi:hypothetical protein
MQERDARRVTLRPAIRSATQRRSSPPGRPDSRVRRRVPAPSMRNRPAHTGVTLLDGPRRPERACRACGHARPAARRPCGQARAQPGPTAGTRRYAVARGRRSRHGLRDPHGEPLVTAEWSSRTRPCMSAGGVRCKRSRARPGQLGRSGLASGHGPATAGTAAERWTSPPARHAGPLPIADRLPCRAR